MKIILGMATVFLMFFIPLFLLAQGIRAAACHSRWSDRPAEYGILSGCRVQVGTIMVPESRVWFERNQ